MNIKLVSILFFVFSANLFLCLASGKASANHKKITVVMSRKIRPFMLAMDGFKEIIKRPFDICVMDEDGEMSILRKIRRGSKKQLILAIGSKALIFAQRNFSDIPIVFTMVSNPSRLLKGRKKNICGVMMETPWPIIFSYLRKIAPESINVGIIFRQLGLEKNLEDIKNMAEEYGLVPILRLVGKPSTAISEFKDMEGKINAFIMLPDPYVFTPRFYEYILLSSLRHRFVLAGLSHKYTKAGTLFSVMGNNVDWGRQAGFIAKKVLEGVSPISILYGYAKKYSLSINLNTAKRIKLKIPDVIKKEARHIVK